MLCVTHIIIGSIISHCILGRLRTPPLFIQQTSYLGFSRILSIMGTGSRIQSSIWGRVRGWAQKATKTCSLMDELPITQVGGCVNPKLKCFFWFTWYHFNYAFIAVLSSVESTYKPISSIEGCQPSFLKSLYSWFYMTVLWIHDHIV